jgi:hypothetical protein
MATAKNKFREKPVDETVMDSNVVGKNDIEEKISYLLLEFKFYFIMMFILYSFKIKFILNCAL